MGGWHAYQRVAIDLETVIILYFSQGRIMARFRRLLDKYKTNPNEHRPVNGDELAIAIQSRFGIAVPTVLVDFWTECGVGYFGEHDLYFFGNPPEDMPRDSIIEWNSKDFWSQLFPPPAEGGPFFFGETCFGRQIGFVLEDQRYKGYLFDVDTMKSYHIADPLDLVFTDVLPAKFPIFNKELYAHFISEGHPVESGMHYAPIVSLLVGGAFEPANYHQEAPNVHLRTTIATWEKIS